MQGKKKLYLGKKKSTWKAFDFAYHKTNLRPRRSTVSWETDSRRGGQDFLCLVKITVCPKQLAAGPIVNQFNILRANTNCLFHIRPQLIPPTRTKYFFPLGWHNCITQRGQRLISTGNSTHAHSDNISDICAFLFLKQKIYNFPLPLKGTGIQSMKDGQTYISEVWYGRQGNLYGFRFSLYNEFNGMNRKINPFTFNDISYAIM
jgi:hypothetical protein